MNNCRAIIMNFDTQITQYSPKIARVAVFG